MKNLLLLLAAAAVLPAQNLTFAIVDPANATPQTALPSAYTFPNTPEGNASTINVKMTNAGSSAVEIVLVYVGASAGSVVANPNFSVTQAAELDVVAPGDSRQFQVNFTPSATGTLSGYLQVTYLWQQNGCTFTGGSSGANCPSGTLAVSTLSGQGTAPQIVLTYNKGNASQSPQPNSASYIDFGNVSTSSSESYTFTLTNETSQTLATPAIALRSAFYYSSAFALDTSALPAQIAANGSATFKVTFAPGQTGLSYATLTVGSNGYNLQGTGAVVTDIDVLQIQYVDATGVRTSPEAATPINFGQLAAGSSGGATLNFTITNPATATNAVTVPTLAATGSAFALTGALSLPVVIQPGASIRFAITFSPSASGTYTGTLAIGTRKFTLGGQSLAPSLPAITFNLSQQPLASQQQVTLAVQSSSATSTDQIGQLTMSFAPAVTGVNDDAAIVFLATGSRQLQLKLSAGATSFTYNNNAAIAFQTGTTAGTITFTLTIPDNAPIKQSFTITPALIHLASGEAERQNPNLLITLVGCDNTYSAGKLTFTFYDLKGNPMTAAPMPFDATGDFQSYFFVNNQAGGAFALQAKFPVQGNVNQIGSVAITVSNSAGQTATNLTFNNP
jgi:hypothetical protein